MLHHQIVTTNLPKALPTLSTVTARVIPMAVENPALETVSVAVLPEWQRQEKPIGVVPAHCLMPWSVTEDRAINP